jgi:hypothetical protein
LLNNQNPPNRRGERANYRFGEKNPAISGHLRPNSGEISRKQPFDIPVIKQVRLGQIRAAVNLPGSL